MYRKKRIFTLGAMCLLGACATLVEEVSGSILVDGMAYETRTRTYERPDGSGYDSTKVFFRGRGYYCDLRGSYDCGDLVRDLIAGNHLNHLSEPAGAGGGYTPPI